MPNAVRIEATTGTPAGRSIRLVPGATIVVGRLPECDVADPGDLHLSRQHCRIEYRGAECVLKNLSSNGTLVNGQRADEVRLRDGDRIECSQLVLKVTIAAEDVPTQRVASAEVATRRERFSTYTAEPCRSGLIRYAGQQEHPDGPELLAKLAPTVPAWAIIDFRKAGVPVPEGLPQRDYLFYWLPEEVIKTGSPLVLAECDAGPFHDAIAAAWGKDAVVCLFTRLEREALVKQLQDATGYRANDEGAGGMLGYCWPGVLNLLLMHQPAEAINGLTQEIDAILVETADAPGGWHLYAGKEFAKALQNLGLREAEEPQA